MSANNYGLPGSVGKLLDTIKIVYMCQIARNQRICRCLPTSGDFALLHAVTEGSNCRSITGSARTVIQKSQTTLHVSDQFRLGQRLLHATSGKLGKAPDQHTGKLPKQPSTMKKISLADSCTAHVAA